MQKVRKLVLRGKELILPIHMYFSLPSTAKVELRRDWLGLPEEDIGAEKSIEAGMSWLCRAQDCSSTNDGGVARHFSLLSGWGSSYPETTGYIVPTMLANARATGNDHMRERGRRMLDWLESIQLPCGGFQGGTINAGEVRPVTFNTGQILLGLAVGAREFKESKYKACMNRAAMWLVDSQDPDGCWRNHPSPFVAAGEKTYDTHVAWGLMEAARVTGDERYADAALRNVRWTLSFQRSNGWIDNCCLTDPSCPLSHTIGYALRGIIEGYRLSRDPSILTDARRTADGVLSALEKDGFLPGRLDSNWSGTVFWTCVTGSVQLAHCLLMLYEDTHENRYRKAAFLLNGFARRTLILNDTEDLRGAVKGSFPIYGDYGKFELLNWACKFLVDSNTLELSIRNLESSSG